MMIQRLYTLTNVAQLWDPLIKQEQLAALSHTIRWEAQQQLELLQQFTRYR